MRHFLSCYDTCSTNDPSFIIGCLQVRFSVLIFDHSATTYSALDVTPVIMFFAILEFKPTINNVKEISWKPLKTIIKSIVFVFLADAVVYLLSFYIAIHNYPYIGDESIKVDVRSCASGNLAPSPSPALGSTFSST